MQNLEVKDTTRKTKKQNMKLRKSLKTPQQTVRETKTRIYTKRRRRSESYCKIWREQGKDIAWLAYYEAKISEKFRSKERFANNMVLKFKVSKSTIVFKIALARLIDDYRKIRDSSLSLHYF